MQGAGQVVRLGVHFTSMRTTLKKTKHLLFFLLEGLESKHIAASFSFILRADNLLPDTVAHFMTN